MRNKENSIPPCRAGQLACVHMEKISSHVVVSWLTSHMNILCFYRSFLKTMRAHLGKLAHLARPAHLLKKSPYYWDWKLIFEIIIKLVATTYKAVASTGYFLQFSASSIDELALHETDLQTRFSVPCFLSCGLKLRVIYLFCKDISYFE